MNCCIIRSEGIPPSPAWHERMQRSDLRRQSVKHTCYSIRKTMSLVVDRMKAVEESDEAGSDDIYLIVFQGRTVSPFVSGLNVIGPGNFWDDFDTGEVENTDHRLGTTNSDGVYAVMMVEKDSDRDIAGTAVVSLWKAQSDLVWKSIMLSLVAGGTPTGTEAAKSAGFAGIKNALNGLASVYMEFPKGDDDVIDVKRVTITQPGQSQTIRFRSNKEDATYDVTFKHTTAA
jgi:hypothetical protein